jgi:hypothetical protein
MASRVSPANQTAPKASMATTRFAVAPFALLLTAALAATLTQINANPSNF